MRTGSAHTKIVHCTPGEHAEFAICSPKEYTNGAHTCTLRAGEWFLTAFLVRCGKGFQHVQTRAVAGSAEQRTARQKQACKGLLPGSDKSLSAQLCPLLLFPWSEQLGLRVSCCRQPPGPR